MLVSNYLSVQMLISYCKPLFLGMLPFPGSSTLDPKEELEELDMKLQRMEEFFTWTNKSSVGR